MNRLTLLSLVVTVVTIVAATGCGGSASKPPTLTEWASSVCAAYSTYGTPKLNNEMKKLYSLRLAALGISDYDAIDPKHPPKFRKDTAKLISRDVMLADIADLQAAQQNMIKKLEGLVEQSPDTEAGRLASRILEQRIGGIRERLDYVREKIEKPVRETYSEQSTPQEANKFHGLLFLAIADPFFEAEFTPNEVAGELDAVNNREAGEVSRAFKAADGCQSWRKSIEQGEKDRKRLSKP